MAHRSTRDARSTTWPRTLGTCSGSTQSYARSAARYTQYAGAIWLASATRRAARAACAAE